MKQQVATTQYGKTLVIEGFNPVYTAPGLTIRGLLELDAIILKNCLNCGQDAVILKQDESFVLEGIDVDLSLRLNLEQLIERWLLLSINEKLPSVQLKY